MGRGVNWLIQPAYVFLASRCRTGDRIFRLGFSRGAYAVRSLAGGDDTVGRVKAEEATGRNIPLVWMLGRLEACGVTLPDGWRARSIRAAA